ncbi:hypothetical protein [Cobetia marina]|uniref:hypothetical protein n=1 Tax=Cobetia marina TaxID=28258 RepID=UPI00384E9230
MHAFIRHSQYVSLFCNNRASLVQMPRAWHPRRCTSFGRRFEAPLWCTKGSHCQPDAADLLISERAAASRAIPLPDLAAKKGHPKVA